MVRLPGFLSDDLGTLIRSLRKLLHGERGVTPFVSEH